LLESSGVNVQELNVHEMNSSRKSKMALRIKIMNKNNILLFDNGQPWNVHQSRR